MRYLKIPNDKNIKSCDQNDETFWSHDLTKIEIAFEISCGDVDSLVIFVIKTGCSNVVLPTLFIVVNNIVQHCYT